MLVKVAWRNLWRNWRRSAIVLASMVVGVAALIWIDALNLGMLRQMLNNQIGAHTAHLQIHRAGFRDNPVVQNAMENPQAVESLLKNDPRIAGYSRRVLTFSMITSPMNASGVTLVGVEPDREPTVTYIARSIVAGSYLSGAKGEILISRRLAEKMDLRLGEKVVAMATALDGTINSDLYRVVGIYQTHSAQFDRTHVYITLSDARRLLGLTHQIMEVAVRLKDLDRLEAVQRDYQRRLGAGFEVLSFRDLLPLLVAMLDVFREMMSVFYLLVGIAMVFGIINTLLMSVMERVPEIGVLMAVGMRGSQIFKMVVLEAFLLGLLGTVLGMALGLAVCLPLAHSGLNLSMFKESLTSFGAGAVIYPALSIGTFVMAGLLVPTFSVLGAMYPAYRAVRLQPVEA
ncbi:MAG: ABC transporter permease, partial [Calditrichaeota bacterium]